MVLFENINVNQRVEVLRDDGNINLGTVRYKGCINGMRGEWVGVDLDCPEGKHDGMVNARRYFSCRPGHGIFTTASQIRFVPLKRSLRDSYRTVSRNSEIDPDLFTPDERPGKTVYVEKTESWIDSEYKRKASAAKFDSRVDEFAWRRYPLRHAVGNQIPSATMLRRSELQKSTYPGNKSSTRPIFDDDRACAYADQYDFISPPAIPKTHMPHSALKRYLSKGSGLHWPREMTVNTGRDTIKLAQWNDISA